MKKTLVQSLALFFTLGLLCTSAYANFHFTAPRARCTGTFNYDSDLGYNAAGGHGGSGQGGSHQGFGGDHSNGQDHFGGFSNDHQGPGSNDGHNDGHHNNYTNDDNHHNDDHGCGDRNPVPEPGTMALFGSGLAGLVGVFSKKRNQ